MHHTDRERHPQGYIQDKLNARLMGVAPTGNGRRESYAHLPMPRMTNTYMLAGESDPEEIIRSVKKGIYCASLGGGQVDITSGKFVFSTSEAYLVEDGRITAPVKGCDADRQRSGGDESRPWWATTWHWTAESAPAARMANRCRSASASRR